MQSILVEKGYWLIIRDNYIDVDSRNIMKAEIARKQNKALATF
jgi:hypothetical protein